MNELRIGLLGPPNQHGGTRLRELLEARGAEAVPVDLEAFPDRIRIAVTSDGIVADGVALDDLSAVWVSAPLYMSGVPAWVPERNEWAGLRTSLPDAQRRHQETRAFRASVLLLLSERVPVINPYASHRASLMQPWLLRRLSLHGIPVAPFVSGNDLERIALFVDEAGQRCRARRLTQRARDEVVADFAFLKSHHEDFDHFPYIVRREVGARRLEAWVVGGSCVGACAGDSWLEGADVPPGVAGVAVRSAAFAGLPLCAVTVEIDSESDPFLVDVASVAGTPDPCGDGREAVLRRLADALVELGRVGSPLPGPRSVPRPPRQRNPKVPRIGIVGRVADAEARVVADAVASRGGEPVPFEIPLFPERRALHECEAGGRVAREDLASFDGLYLRQTGVSSPLPDPDQEPVDAQRWDALYDAYARFPRDQGECLLFKYAVMHILGERVDVINPPDGQEVHRNKVWQLFSLGAQGLPVPPTVAGNDPEACQRFVEDQGGPDQVVVKPLAGIYKTHLLSEWGLDAALEAGPVILQRYVRGDTIRAYIADGRLVGAGRIVHDTNTVDSSLGQTGVEPVDLPGGAVSAGWNAARHLGLRWTGMDFMKEASTGRFFILECNASSMFANFSRRTGYDVPGALAACLW